MAQLEVKFFDGTTGAPATVPTTGQIKSASLNLIPAGVGESERLGRAIYIKDVQIRGATVLVATSTAINTDETIRCIVYVDNQCNGATAAVTDILETAEWNSFLNLSNSQRFRVLASFEIDINASAAWGDTAPTSMERAKSFKIYRSVNERVEFSTEFDDISDVSSSNLGVLLIARQGQGSVTYRWRIRFSDT